MRILLFSAALCCMGVVIGEAPASPYAASADPYGTAAAAAAAAYGAADNQYAPAYTAPAGYGAPVAPYGYTAPKEYTAGTGYTGAKDNSYGIQSGYEGYLVPMDNTQSLMSGLGQAASLFASSPGLFGGGGGEAGLFSGGGPAFGLHSLLSRPWLLSFLPRLGLKIAGKVGLWLLGFTFIVLIGGGFTVAVCTFTPICTLTFLGFGFSRQSMRSYLTPDRLTAVTTFVTEAIDKYREMQGKSRKKQLPPAKNLSPYVKPLQTKPITTEKEDAKETTPEQLDHTPKKAIMAKPDPKNSLAKGDELQDPDTEMAKS